MQEEKEWNRDLDTQKEILTILKEEGSRSELCDTVSVIMEELKRNLSPEQALSLQRFLFDMGDLKVEPKSLPPVSTLLFDKAFTNQTLPDTDIQTLITLIRTSLFPELLDSVVSKHKRTILSQKTGFYIVGKGKKNSDDNRESAISLLKVCSDFIASPQKVLLLLGDSGSGKSSFGIALERDMWKSYQPGGVIPLFISLAYWSSADPHTDLIQKVLRKQGYSEAHIRELREKQRSLLVFIDGYDEIGTLENLYATNKLSDWNVKVIITCRLEYLRGRLKGHSYRFIPEVDGQLQSEGLSEYYMSRFSADQIKEFLIGFIRNNREEKVWGDWRHYITYINKYQLSEMVENPYLLYIVACVLPTIVENHQKRNKIEFQKLTRSDLYHKFIELWILRHLDKLAQVQKLGLLGNEDPYRKLEDFIQKLAIAMEENNAYEIDLDKIRKLRPIGENSVTLSALLQASPIRPIDKPSGVFYSFLHPSLRDFLANKAAFDEISENAGISNALQSIIPQQRKEVKSNTISLLPVPVDAEDRVKSIESERFRNIVLNKINICNRPEAINWWLEQLENNSERQKIINKLREVLYLSKDKNEIETAAANAITILIAAGEAFSDEDLSHVHIRGANLNGGIFDHTIFRHADLREVSFVGAWIRKADFAHAKMAGVDFGERAKFNLGYFDGNGFVAGDKLVAFSKDFLWIAKANESEIKLYNSETQRLHCTFTGHSDLILSLEFGPDNILASGSKDGTVRLWDVKGCGCLHTVTGHQEGVYTLVFGKSLAPGGSYRTVLASGGCDKTIRIWDVQKMILLHTFDELPGKVINLAFRENLLISCCSDSDNMTTHFWNVNEMRCMGSSKGKKIFR